METLEFATPAISVCTRDRARSTSFYRDSLGLALEREDALAAVFRAGGVVFERFSHLPQDELGIFALPGGKIHVAWFKDPDGNILSVTNV
jgi:catechol 2,3-dioxygenase-like lactoylglutathione lyase family enzyme